MTLEKTQDPRYSPDAALLHLGELPLLMTPTQYAELRDVSIRTLERQRVDGTGTPYVRIGRKVYYTRDAILHDLAERTYRSTAEAKRAKRAAR